MQRYHFSLSQEYLSSFEVWVVEFWPPETGVEVERKGSVCTLTLSVKGEYLGTKGRGPGRGRQGPGRLPRGKARGSEWWSSTGGPGDTKPRASQRFWLKDRMPSTSSATVGHLSFHCLRLLWGKSIACIKMLTEKNPAFLHPGVQAISDTRNNMFITKHQSQIAGR